MYKKLLLLFLAAFSQIETGFCDDKGVSFPNMSQPSEYFFSQDNSNPNELIDKLELRKKSFSNKVYKDLTREFDSKKFLQNLGPGVTGGGVRCAQEVAYSFDFLRNLIKRNKIKVSIEGKTNLELLRKIDTTILSFGDHLKKNENPVDALNIPSVSRIIIDRKTCNYPISSLHFFTPLLFHEVLSLLAVKDENYQVSVRFVDQITKQIASKESLGNFDLSVKETDAIKVLIWRELRKQSVNNLIIKNCGLLSDKFSANETISDSVESDDLVLLPVTQSFRDTWDKQQKNATVREENYSILVSGIGTHLGNRGQTYMQCLLNTFVKIFRPENGRPSISVEIIESKQIGETFTF